MPILIFFKSPYCYNAVRGSTVNNYTGISRVETAAIQAFLESEDSRQAELALKDTLNYCNELMRKPSQEKRGLVVWDTADGNVDCGHSIRRGFLALVF
jgi:hypothetical protein